MRQLIKEVEQLVPNELERANKQWLPFHSPHEGYAVMLEELSEAEFELLKLKSEQKKLWEEVKQNNLQEQFEIAKRIKQTAILLACESIQVAAMCDKYQQLKYLEADNE